MTIRYTVMFGDGTLSCSRYDHPVGAEDYADFIEEEERECPGAWGPSLFPLTVVKVDESDVWD